ncbi:MAG: hypothetical protein L0210_12170 [Rhodospirillales bacterium]|nr:hypothetical protein [Rhodospirillales bacterium]
MKRTKDDDGLTVQQARFCRLIAQGEVPRHHFLRDSLSMERAAAVVFCYPALCG